MSHVSEFCIGMEVAQLKYTEDGNTVGELEETPPVPNRLKWDLHPECLDLIRSSTLIASDIIAEVDLQVLYHSAYGKSFIKKFNVGPDAFVQMVLQLTYYRDAVCFNLTYEAAMVRLFREGRTETVRTVTTESCKFLLSVDNPDVPMFSLRRCNVLPYLQQENIIWNCKLQNIRWYTLLFSSVAMLIAMKITSEELL